MDLLLDEDEGDDTDDSDDGDSSFMMSELGDERLLLCMTLRSTWVGSSLSCSDDLSAVSSICVLSAFGTTSITSIIFCLSILLLLFF